jgi:hypothetical protein
MKINKIIKKKFLKRKISFTSGSNISLVIANVPFEIKHEQIALSDIKC